MTADRRMRSVDHQPQRNEEETAFHHLLSAAQWQTTEDRTMAGVERQNERMNGANGLLCIRIVL